jgi:hypothetical protein
MSAISISIIRELVFHFVPTYLMRLSRAGASPCLLPICPHRLPPWRPMSTRVSPRADLMAARRRLVPPAVARVRRGRADLSARLCSALLCILTGVRSPVAPHGQDGCTDGAPWCSCRPRRDDDSKSGRRAVATGWYTGEQGCSCEQ